MNTQRRRRCTSNLLNAVSIFCKESQNLFRGLSRRARRDLRPIQKEGQPVFPGTVCSYALKQFVVPITIRLEVEAEVQKRLPQRTLRAKQERLPTHARLPYLVFVELVIDNCATDRSLRPS